MCVKNACTYLSEMDISEDDNFSNIPSEITEKAPNVTINVLGPTYKNLVKVQKSI